MQKSMSKTVVVLKTAPDSCFEEAHLILRDKFDQKIPSTDMVEQANRIILQAENAYQAQKTGSDRENPRRDLRYFFWGILTGLAACALGAFLLSLLI